MSDFKTNEYANLIGGAELEPKESNARLSRCLALLLAGISGWVPLECRAIRRTRRMGFNVVVMIPFCRSPDEADRVLGWRSVDACAKTLRSM